MSSREDGATSFAQAKEDGAASSVRQKGPGAATACRRPTGLAAMLRHIWGLLLLALVLGAATSARATVTVTVSPTSVNLCGGDQQTFTETYSVTGCESSPGTATYQWYLDNVLVSGQTNSTYLYTAPATSGSHTVKCTVTTQNCGSGTSAASTVTVTAKGISITSATDTPTSATNCTPITFSGSAVENCGSGTITYSWDFKDGVTTPFTSSASATHTYATAGTYTPVLTATDGVYTSTRAAATITVTVPAVPGVPTGLTATAASATQVNLSWTAPAGGATSYNIYRQVSGGSFAFLKNVTTTSTTDTGLLPNTSYCYYVKALNSCAVEGAASSTACVTTLSCLTMTLTGPANPSSPTVCDSPTFTATVTDGCSGGALTYVWTLTLGSNTTTYNGLGATFTPTFTTAGTYTVGVTASNASGAVAKSVVFTVAAEVTPPTPTGLTATPSGSSITLQWSGTWSLYAISRATSSAGPFVQIGTSTTTSYTDTGLEQGQTFYYKVAGKNGCGHLGTAAGPASATVTGISLNSNIIVTISPATSTITPGSVTLTATINSGGCTGTPTISWYLDGVLVPGATSTVCTVTLTGLGAHKFDCYASYGACGVGEGIATVYVDDGPPTIATAAAANPNPVAGATTNLTVLGADDEGEQYLTYTWSATGPAAVTYSVNGTNAAKSTTATFTQSGSYTFTVTVTNTAGNTVTSSVVVTVNQTLASLAISPSSAALHLNGAQSFSPIGTDQFGAQFAAQPAFAVTWSLDSGSVGAIDQYGFYQAAATPGTATVRATSGAITATASVTVTNAAPTIVTAASATPNPATTATTALSVLGDDDGGEPGLTYTWSATGPAALTYSANGTNGAKNTTATFTQSGSYTFVVTVADTGGLTVTSSVSVQVVPSIASIAVTPSTAAVPLNATRAFAASAYDQFGNILATQPTFVWSIDQGGVGSIAQSGIYSSGVLAGTAVVRAGAGGFSGSATVTVANAAPTVYTAATATPNPVTAKTTALSVTGADDGGEPLLIYTWSATGPAPVTFSANGSNTSKNTTATFAKSGSYTFAVSIADANGLTVSSSVVVTVNQTLTTINVTPATVSLTLNKVQQFTAVGFDQFGDAMLVQPTFTWTRTSGVGSLSASGSYTSGGTPGTATVRAASGAINGTATVTVTNAAPTIATAASASPNPVTGTTTVLSALGADDASVSSLAYTWTASGPAPVTFSANGTNAAKTDTATFTHQGTYTFTVTITDTGGLTAKSMVTVVVNTTLTSIAVTPSTASLALNTVQQYNALGIDQFGAVLTTQPSFTWSVVSGGVGTISATGLYNSGGTAGTATVRAASGAITGSATVTVANTAPAIATAAVADPNPVNGSTTTLFALGADDGGEANLKYTWSATGPAAVTFSANGTNASKSATATFTKSGSYTFTVTVADAGALTAASSVTVQVNQTLATLTVSPATASINLNASQQFAASGADQFGVAMATQPSWLWTIDSGGVGSIAQSGLYTSSSTAGTAIVRASSAGVSATATVTVVNAAPTVAIAAAANPNPVNGGTTTNLTVLGADDGGEPNLTYTWSVVGPSGSHFSANGANAAKNVTATFTQPGSYTFTVTITDAGGRTVPSSVTVSVYAIATTVVVSPATASMNLGGTQQFSATAKDQFGVVLGTQPAFTWSVDAGGVGTISASGLYSGGNAPGTATVRATSGGISGSAAATVSNGVPTVAIAAAANPNPVTATTTNLTVLGADDGGEANLTYTWSATGPAAVTFSANSTNAAKNTTATFSKAGSYIFMVTIRDAMWLSTTSSVTVPVNQTTTSLVIQPSSAVVNVNSTQQFSALVSDQFGNAMTTQPALTWTLDSGVGSIASSGIYTSGWGAGTAVVRATAGAASGTASVTVNPSQVDLGVAGPLNWAVLGLGGAGANTTPEVSLTGQVVIAAQPWPGSPGVSANIGVPATGGLKLAGSGLQVSGTIYVNQNGQIQNSSSNTFTIAQTPADSGIDDTILNPAKAAAFAAATWAGSLTDTMTATIGSGATTIMAQRSGVNVLTFSSLTVSNPLTFSGSLGSSFVIRVTGNMTVNPGGFITYSGGIRPSDIMFVVKGTGQQTVHLNSAADPTAGYTVAGIILCPNGDIQVEKSVVRGSVIGSTIEFNANSGLAGVQDPGLPSDILSLTANPASLIGGQSSTGSVTLSGPAPTGGVTVTLSSTDNSHATPASSVLILAGTNGAFFNIATQPVSAVTTATIMGSYNGQTKSAQLIINPPSIISLTLSPTSVIGTHTSVGTVTLSGNAPTGGIAVALSSDNAAAGVPASVTVPAGTNAASFTVTTQAVGAPTAANITGVLNGKTQGTLTITPPTLALTIAAPKQAVGGNPIGATLSLSDPAPTGYIVSLSSSVPAAQPPATVTIAAGTTSQGLTIQTVPVATATSAVITGTPPSGAPASDTLQIGPDTLTVTLTPASVTGGIGSAGTVTLSQAIASNLTVYLTSDNASAGVPASVTIPAGQTTASFTASTIAVGATTQATISATAGALSGSAILTITPPAIVGLSVSPSAVEGAVGSTGTVTIASAAPTGGAYVALSSDNVVAGVPSGVTIPANTTSVTFPVTTTAVATAVVATLTASNSISNATAQLTVNPPSLSSLVVVPAKVVGGRTAIGTVTLNSAAPTGGITASLSCSDPFVKIPSTLSFAAGAVQASFAIPTQIVSAERTDIFTASLSGGSVSGNLIVTPITLKAITLTPATVTGGDGTVVTGTVTISDPAPMDVGISLNSDTVQVVLTNAFVVVKKGSTTSSTFKIVTAAVTTDTSAVIAATLADANASPTPVTAALLVKAPRLTGLSISPTAVEGTAGAVATVTIGSPAGTGGLVVALGSDSTAYGISVPASVTIPANTTSTTFPVTTSAVPSVVVATISANAAGSTASAPLTVNPPRVLTVTLNPTSVLGGQGSMATVTISSAASASGLAVTTASDNTAASVAGTAFIAPGQTTGTFAVSTVAVSTVKTPHISASINGSSAYGILTVNPPALFSVALNPGSVAGGLTSTGTVTLTGPAGTGGIIVALSVPGSTDATVPVRVTVPAGSATTTFTVNTVPVLASETVLVSALLSPTTKTAPLTINPAGLLNLTLSPTSVTGGASSTATVTISSAAPTGGTTINLLSNKAAQGVTVPSTVTVGAGLTTATFTVSTLAVGADLSATISASLSGVTRNASLGVLAPALTSVSVSPASVMAGNPSTGTVLLSGAAPVGGLSVATSSDTTGVTVIGTVTVPAGQTQATFPIATSPSSPPVTAIITGTLASVSKTASLTVIAGAPVLTTIVVNPPDVVLQTNQSQQFNAVAYDQYGVALVSQPTFSWAVSGGGAIGASTGLFTAGGTTGGPYTVTATANGISGKAAVRIEATSATDSPLQPGPTVMNTDWASAGYGGMRNYGTGTLTLSGVSGTVTRAYLYWDGPTNTTAASANATVTFNGHSVTGNNIGFASDNCWGYLNSQAYRADVTSFVTGNGSYSLANFAKSAVGGSYSININGVELIVFFNDGNATNNKDVYVFDGNDSNVDSAGSWDDTFPGINYTSGTANMWLCVADGQSWADAPVYVNNNTIASPDSSHNVFAGTSVSNGSSASSLFGGLWDMKSFNITSLMKAGTNSLHLVSPVYSDCLGLVAAVIEVPSTGTMVTASAPTVAVAAAANPNPVAGATTQLTVLGADATGESNLTYIWKVAGAAPAAVNFSDNGTNSAKTCTATFTMAGDYNLQVTIRNTAGLGVTSAVLVHVNQTPTAIFIAPTSATVSLNGTQAFSAAVADQFGAYLTTQPTFVWSVDAGGVGSVTQSGLYSAGPATGTAVVRVQAGSLAAIANVVVANGAPTILSVTAIPNPVSGTTTALSVTATDDGGEPALTYAWSLLGSAPAPVTFSANGTNAAKSATATFVKPGNYSVQVTVTDASGLTATAWGTVEVDQTLTALSVSPAQVTIPALGTQLFTAGGIDQFGGAMTLPSVATWSVISGVGAIDTTGHYTAPAAGGGATVQATVGSVTGVAYINGFNAAPSIAVAASASPNPVTGTTTTLSVVGADDGGPANLTYTWATLGTPPAPVTYSANGTNAAKSATATFTAPGVYTFQVTVTDGGGLSATSSVVVQVVPTLTALSLTPATATVLEMGTQQFTATGVDQFGVNVPSLPTLTWSVSPTNGGTVDANGFYTAPLATGTAQVTATAGSISASAIVTVGNAAPTIVTAASATPNPVAGTTTTALSVLASDPAGESTLIYTWSPTGTVPAPVTFSSNGTNASKYVTATFTAPGVYTFQVVAKDLLGLTASSTVVVTVNATATKIVVNPVTVSLLTAGTQQFSATEVDQFGHALASQPTYTWSVSGGGTISAGGLFTAGGSAGGPYTVTATAGSLSGKASVTVVAAAPVLTSIAVTPATATVVQSHTQQFSATALDQYGNALSSQPTFTWSVSPANGGTVTSAGLYTAPASATGTAGVVATSGSVSGSAVVTLTAPGGPTIAIPASASPNPVTGKTTNLSVLGADPDGEGTLTYTWALVGTAPAAVTFSANATNAAKNCTATFSKAGSYTLQVTVTDQHGLTATSSVTVIVSQTLTSLSVSPASASVLVSTTQQFTATGLGQFSAALAIQPNLTWSVSGGGAIDPASGLFTAGKTAGGPYTVTATSGSISATAAVTVTSSVSTSTPTAITCGQTISGNLATTDGASTARGAGYYADKYTFQATAGQPVVISMRSTAIDSFLSLYDPTGAKVAQDDDSPSDAAPATADSQIVYTMPATLPGNGVYTIECTTSNAAQTGPYTVGVACSTGAPANTLQVSYVDGSGSTVIVPSSGSYNFGSTALGTSVTKAFTLTNTGLVDVALSGASSTSNLFGLTSSLPAVLEAGQSLAFSLGYSGSATGSGTWSLTNTSASNPYKITLSGTVTTTTATTLKVISVTPVPQAVIGGATSTVTVTLNQAPTAAAGQSVTLTDGNQTLVPLPTTVTVPMGQVSASVTTHTTAPTDNTEHSVTISAYTFNPDGSQASKATTQLAVFPASAVPTVAISSPANNGTVAAGQVPVTATASASYTGATIKKVNFLAATVTNGVAGAFTQFAEATASPYTVTWNQATTGTYQLQAIATDSNGLTATSSPVTVTVSSLPAVTAPVISATNNTGAVLAANGTSAGFATVSLSDSFTTTNSQPVVIYYTIDGSTPDPTTSPRYTASFRITAGTTTKTITVKAIAVAAGYLNSPVASAGYTLTPTATLAAPTASITSPVDGGEAMGQAPITGIATGPAFGYWQIDCRPVDDTTGPWRPVGASTTPSTGGAFQVLDPLNPGQNKALLWDTSLMLDGQYDLRLTVYDTDGKTAQTDNYVVVKGHQKIGYFTLSYTDMTIPIAGIPISITRTYDSRDKTLGDFGVGWKLSTTNVKVQKPEISAFNWEQVQYGNGFGLTYAVQPMRAHNITITLPGDTVYSFQEQLNPYYAVYQPMIDLDTNVKYVQLSGPKATLTPLDEYGNVLSTTVVVQSANDTMVNGKHDPNLGNSTGITQAVQLYESDLETPYNPSGFIMTLHNGSRYKLDTSGNLLSIMDRNGNEVDFGPGGISSKDGRTITILRSGGASSPIVGIKDMMGHTFSYAQDGQGNLASATDRMGNTTTYDYDAAHNLTIIRNALGNMPVRNYYYPDGRLNYTLDAQDHRTDYYYDQSREPNGRQPGFDFLPLVPADSQVVANAFGNPTVFTYDSYGNVTATTQYVRPYVNGVQGARISLTTYKAYGDGSNPELPTLVTSPLRDMVKFTYTQNGDMASSTDPLGKITKFTYDQNGQLISKTNAKGKIEVTNTYDANGNLALTVDAKGNATAYEYDSRGNQISRRDAKGAITKYAYDSVGSVISVVDSAGNVTSYERDLDDCVTARTSLLRQPDGSYRTAVTRNYYNASGDLVRTELSNGAASEIQYNELGAVEARKLASGAITRYLYDVSGRKTAVVRPNGFTTEFVYDAAGQVAEMRTPHINESGNMDLLVTRSLYDDIGRPYGTEVWQGVPGAAGSIRLSQSFKNLDANELTVSEADSHGITSQITTYDANENITSVEDAYGNVQTFEYDELGQLVKTTDPSSAVTSTTYDDNGNEVTRTTPAGTTRRVVDSLDQLIGLVDATGLMTRFEYDSKGKLITTILPDGATTRFTYDERGKKTSQTDANGHTTRFTYNDAGQLIARQLPLGQVETFEYSVDGSLTSHTDFNKHTTTYEYDALTGVRTRKAGFDGVVTYTYWPDGSLWTATKNGKTAIYYWDVRGRLVRVVQSTGALVYSYDDRGRRTSMTRLDGVGNIQWAVSYQYDAKGNLGSIIHSDGSITERTEDLLDIIRPNGVQTHYDYDGANRLTHVGNTKGSSFSYVYDAAGRKLSATDTVRGTTSYHYDAAGRLVTEVGPSGSITYEYDAVGNRIRRTSSSISTTYEFDENDRLLNETTSGVSTTYHYDDNGNLTSYTTGSATYTFGYDFEDKMISASSPSGQVSFTYGADGNRLSKTWAGGGISYVVDVAAPFAEVVEEDDAISGAVIARYETAFGATRVRRGTATEYLLKDGHGNTSDITDASGTPTDTYSYDAYGTVTHDTGTSSNPFLYNGQQYDPEVGLYYLRARYYSSRAGRFLGQDPLPGYSDSPYSLHRYLYANDDPVNFIDPSGQETLAEMVTVTGNIATLIKNVVSIYNVANKAYNTAQTIKTIVDYAPMVTDIVEAFSMGGTSGGASEIAQVIQKQLGVDLSKTPDFFSSFGSMFDTIGKEWNDASEAVVNRAPEIGANAVKYIPLDLGGWRTMLEAKNGRTAVALILPSTPLKFSRADTKYVPITVRGEKVWLALQVGGGVFFGVGFHRATSGPTKKDSSNMTIFRIDYWDYQGLVERLFLHYHLWGSAKRPGTNDDHWPIWDPIIGEYPAN